jgi:hypothetical protein
MKNTANATKAKKKEVDELKYVGVNEMIIEKV